MAKPLETAQIEAALKDLPGWAYEGSALRRSYRFGNFSEAMAFIVKVGFIAERLDHHPEIRNVYSSVDLAVQSHDAGNAVTAKDVEFAEAVSSLDS